MRKKRLVGLILVLAGLAVGSYYLVERLAQTQAPFRILKYPHPLLRVNCEQVEVVDDEMRRLIDDMILTIQVNRRAGLAAPQVGVAKRVIVVETEEGPMGFVNPEILWRSDEEQVGIERCLSMPGRSVAVKRATEIVVKALDRDGKEIMVEAKGYKARVFQHEIDHINGILISDREDSANK